MKSVNSDQSPEFSAKIYGFKDLLAWKKSLLSLRHVYKVTKLIMAYELKFLSELDLAALTKRCSEVGKMLNGLMRSLSSKLHSEL